MTILATECPLLANFRKRHQFGVRQCSSVVQMSVPTEAAFKVRKLVCLGAKSGETR